MFLITFFSINFSLSISDSFCSHSSCSECGESSAEHSDNNNANEPTSPPQPPVAAPVQTTDNDYSRSKPEKLPKKPVVSPHTKHPPLPVVINHPKKYHKKHWQTHLDPPYMPPLPFFKANHLPQPPPPPPISSKNSMRTIVIKSPEHKPGFSTNTLTKNRYYTGTSSSNIRLVDPPLPTVPGSNAIKKTNSQDNLLHTFSAAPGGVGGQLYHLHNSRSTDGLNKLQRTYEDAGGTAAKSTSAAATLKVAKVPRTQLKRNSLQPQQHMVIDVFPKPLSQHHQTDWTTVVPDQTLGIPLTFSHNLSTYQTYVTAPQLPPPIPPPPFHHHRNASAGLPTFNPKILLKSQSMFNVGTSSPLSTTAQQPPQPPPPPPPKIHEHPMTSANIPPSSSLHLLASADAGSGHFTITKKKPTALKTNDVVVKTSILTSNLPPQQPPQQPSTVSPKKESGGERNKVKFSDTVTVAVVPVKSHHSIITSIISTIDRHENPIFHRKYHEKINLSEEMDFTRC